MILRIIALLTFMFVAGEGYHHDHWYLVPIGLIGCIVTLVLMVGHADEETQ